MIAVDNLGALFARHGASDKLAFIGLDSGLNEKRYSYADLDGLADGVARSLRDKGLQRGERVAILAANSVESIATALGTMRAGCIVVPINFRFPPKLIDFVIGDSGARLVYCDQARLANVPAGLPRIVFDGAEAASAFSSHLDRGPFETVAPASNETAMILYTSGSTGKPKGVLLSHQSHTWVVKTRLADGMPEDERLLIAAPLYHMNALSLSLLSIAAHATTVLLPEFTAAAYIKAIDRYRCTFLTSVPPMIAMMLREKALLASADLSSVRAIRMGSAPVSESLLARISEVFPQARIENAYGTTEGGPVVFGAHPGGIAVPRLSVGHARPEVATRLIDDAGQESDQGMLQVKSPGLMKGYHQRPDLALPFTADGFYDTGDVFRRDAAGFHYFVGRRDDMFVSGGENIHPGEVERMLEQHPGVLQACVVPVEDDIKGQKPVAFVVARREVALDPDDLKRYALANGPAYQHPRFIWLLDAMPLASTKKIDRQALVADAARRMAAFAAGSAH